MIAGDRAGNRKEPDSLLGEIFHLVPKVERENPGDEVVQKLQKNSFETLKRAVTLLAVSTATGKADNTDCNAKETPTSLCYRNNLAA